MIDLSQNKAFLLLEPIDTDTAAEAVTAHLIAGERIVSCFKTIRDVVVFTDKRLITVDVQGIRGKRRDFSSFPYSRVQAFSVGTAGTLDVGAELELWFSSLGRITLGFKGRYDVAQLGQMVAAHVLQ